MQIHLIQYMRPNGRQVDAFCEVDNTYKEKYELILKLGLNFSCESLPANMVSIILEHKLLELDFMTEVCKNEPGLPLQHLEKMLKEFDENRFKKVASAAAKMMKGRRSVIRSQTSS